MPTLLAHLRSEYYQIKKADAIIQNQKARWMSHVERWMHHQDQLLASTHWSDSLKYTPKTGLSAEGKACLALREIADEARNEDYSTDLTPAADIPVQTPRECSKVQFEGGEAALPLDADEKVYESGIDLEVYEEEYEEVYAEQSLAIQNWKAIVQRTLQSARKQLRQLHPTWIKTDRFIMKNLDQGGGEIGLPTTPDDVPVRSTRRSLLSTLSQAKRQENPYRDDDGGKQKQKGPYPWYLLTPTSSTRLGWVSLGVALMCYDLAYIPLAVFDPGDNTVTQFLGFFAQTYWTMDIMMSFITGVTLSGELVMNPTRIAEAYLKGWFVFDVVVTTLLWITELMGNQHGGMKAVRFVRMIRLLRLAKFERLLGEALEFINSSTLILCCSIFKIMLYLITLNHFVACLWYHIGDIPQGWVQVRGINKSTLGYKYLSAMHWALTQFQGTSDIVPGSTSPERMFAVLFLVLALIILASFVSTLTNMTLQLQSLKDERNRQQRSIRVYLMQNKISRELAMRVKRYVEWRLNFLNNQETDLETLKMLPPALVMELLYEVRGQSAVSHDFMRALERNFIQCFKRLCYEALVSMAQAPGELIFGPSEECKSMYFIIRGRLQYTPRVVNKARGVNSYDIKPRDWLCEATLWVNWQHCGDLIALSDASAVALIANKFRDVLRSHPQAHAAGVIYGRAFVEALNRFGKNYTDFIDGPLVNMQDLHLNAAESFEDQEHKTLET